MTNFKHKRHKRFLIKKEKEKKDDINDFWANLVIVNCIFADE